MKVTQWTLNGDFHNIECENVSFMEYGVLCEVTSQTDVIIPYATSLRIVIQED